MSDKSIFNKDYKDYIDARETFIARIKAQILGPGSELADYDEERAKEEIITDKPGNRYSCGILFPQPPNISTGKTREDEVVEETEDDEFDGDEFTKDSEFGDMYRAIQAEDEQPAKNSKKGNEHEGKAEETTDDDTGLQSQWYPSAFGLTFFVESEVDEVNCHLSFGTYKKLPLQNYVRVANDENIRLEDFPKEIQPFLALVDEGKNWTLRKHLSYKDWKELKVSDSIKALLNALSWQAKENRYKRKAHLADVKIRFRGRDHVDENDRLDGTKCKITASRRKMNQGFVAVTLNVVNDEKDKDINHLRRNQESFIFQPRLEVRTSDNNFRFCDRNQQIDMVALDEEELRLNMLYRNKRFFASGHGSSVVWKIDEDGNGCIYNEFVPSEEIPAMDFALASDINKRESYILSMKYHSDLVNMPIETKCNYLKQLLESYGKWIDDVEKAAKKMPEVFYVAAEHNLKDCRESLSRMNKGLELLQEDKKVQKAFALANRAMFMQRVHLQFQKNNSDAKHYSNDQEVANWLTKLDYVQEEDKHFWRPFQIAFLLMSIPGIVDESSEDRKILDLIWFPTGGGKTEAYLGLSAFVIFYRRMAHPEEAGGTNIIMRYTLRLLTAQQFTRAATLICACEAIRRNTNETRNKSRVIRSRRTADATESALRLGDEPITIGLWIGGEHTPNKIADANDALTKLKNNSTAKNPFQVLQCPWCGTEMIPAQKTQSQMGYMMEGKSRFYFQCPQANCLFHGGRGHGLPVQVVDEELYRKPSTLLIGTVDKFAMMAWNHEIRAFFQGRGPELIIQDELHLISGPLGSMVGLYEAAIDAVCQKNGHMPKMIASTATIRRAETQCSALYNRDIRQFPAPGIEASDSYFAKETAIDYEKGVYGRRYIGFMPTGIRKTTMEIRMLAYLLETAHVMDLSDNVKDMIWTITAYFNSLRELGQCDTYIDSDVRDEIKYLAQRLGKMQRFANKEELTSRVSTTKLNRILNQLEVPYHQRQNEKEKRTSPIDVLLSSNMISVGIDVSRLNVMLMVGQPKLASEYIQATSRVGRSLPGVVFTLFDAGRSRDRSYYEQFKSFHETFYKHVEPTGATPFSKPARERALHSVIVSMMRMISPQLAEDGSAGQFSKDKYQKEIDDVKTFILKRVAEIRQRSNSLTRDDRNEICQEMEAFFDSWDNLAKRGELIYGRSQMVHADSTIVRLLRPFHQKCNDKTVSFETLTSMRNVDSMIPGKILIWEAKQ